MPRYRAKVAILLGTRNGAQYLPVQLESIAAQSMQDWVLVVSDDGSRDATCDMLREFSERVGRERIIVRQGPQTGFVGNFLSLACEPGGAADYYAFCDQDDFWFPDKLKNALARLSELPSDAARLYCGRTELVDENGSRLGFSHRFERPPAFSNALVQSIAGANTMVFDEAARRLLERGGKEARVPSHDWWLYQLVSGSGGRVIYDPVPEMAYRQHGWNVQGQNVGFAARFSRLFRLLRGEFRIWNEQNVAALQRVSDCLTEDNRRLLEAFEAVRRKRGLAAGWALKNAGLYRQRGSDNFAMLLAAALGQL